MFSVADGLMYSRIILNLEEMFMVWGGRDELKFQQPNCHSVIRLSEYMGLSSGINDIICCSISIEKMYQEKGEDLLNFKIILTVNNHDHIFIACGILIFIVTMK